MDNKVYWGDFEPGVLRDEPGLGVLAHEFLTVIAPDIEILFAWYAYQNYSGSAFVLFRQNGLLYEVNGSHCSCYGLEGQWMPELTDAAVLRERAERKVQSYGGETYAWNEDMAAEARAALLAVLAEPEPTEPETEEPEPDEAAAA